MNELLTDFNYRAARARPFDQRICALHPLIRVRRKVGVEGVVAFVEHVGDRFRGAGTQLNPVISKWLEIRQGLAFASWRPG